MHRRSVNQRILEQGKLGKPPGTGDYDAELRGADSELEISF